METTPAERATRGIAKANVPTAPIAAQDAFAFSQAFIFPWRIENAKQVIFQLQFANVWESSGSGHGIQTEMGAKGEGADFFNR